MPDEKQQPAIRGDAFTVTPSDPFRIDEIKQRELAEALRRKSIPEPGRPYAPQREAPDSEILPSGDPALRK